jgi:hypothetical protein
VPVASPEPQKQRLEWRTRLSKGSGAGRARLQAHILLNADRHRPHLCNRAIVTALDGSLATEQRVRSAWPRGDYRLPRVPFSPG